MCRTATQQNYQKFIQYCCYRVFIYQAHKIIGTPWVSLNSIHQEIKANEEHENDIQVVEIYEMKQWLMNEGKF